MLSGCDLFQDQAIKQANQFIAQQNIDKSKDDWKTSLPQPAEFTFSQDKSYLWNLTTSQGEISIKLMPDIAPKHVSSTLYLATLGYYDNTIFHRVIPGFMIQSGDPNSKNDNRGDDGTGGAGPGVDSEFTSVPHKRGILSMARSNNPNSARSQFFICVSDSSMLDNKYSVFGLVVEGMEVADAIVNLPRDRRDNPNPDNPAIIHEVVVEERTIPARPAWSKL